MVLLTPNIPKTYFCGLSLLKMTPKTRLVFLQPMLRTSRLFLRIYIYIYISIYLSIHLSIYLSLSFPWLSQGASRCWENLDFQKFQLALSLDPTAEIPWRSHGPLGGAVTNSYTGFPQVYIGLPTNIRDLLWALGRNIWATVEIYCFGQVRHQIGEPPIVLQGVLKVAGLIHKNTDQFTPIL